jgi:Mg2+-importing ATPase
MIVFGGLSTCFDLATFAVLLWGFDVGTVTFRSAWFIESTLTELAVLFALRTTRPLYRSRPGRILVILSVVVAVAVVAIPFVPALADPLGLDALGLALLLTLAGITLAYVAANELVKRLYFREVRRA